VIAVTNFSVSYHHLLRDCRMLPWCRCRLYRQLTLIVDNPEDVYSTADAVWLRFESLFISTFGLLLYAPVFKAYFYEALQQFYDDGVQYMELRSLFLPVRLRDISIFYVSEFAIIILTLNNYLTDYMSTGIR